MELVFYTAIFLCFAYSAYPAFHGKHRWGTIYKYMQVKFPEDVCDDREIKMPNFYDNRRRISEVKCMEYVWRLKYEQGKEKRLSQCNPDWVPLIGGSGTSDGEYAHMGALGWKAKNGTWIFKCGGSLISERYVLTAAHCSSVAITDKTVAELNPKIVRLGCKSILDVHKGIPAYDANILSFIQYPRYVSPKQYYDIALVKLEKSVPFEFQVHPACLWTEFDHPDRGNLTGWGVVEIASLKVSPMLQQAETGMVESKKCDSMLVMKRNKRKWWGLRRHQLCAGDANGRIDTCQGDSGGPLQTLIPLDHDTLMPRWSMHKIIGVTSFGFGCGSANYPSIYTRVSTFVQWIEDEVWPSDDADTGYMFVFGT